MYVYLDKSPKERANEIHIKDDKNTPINIAIKPSYTPSTQGNLLVESVLFDLETETKYNELRNNVEDLRDSSEKLSKTFMEEYNSVRSNKCLYVQIENLEEYSGLFNNLNTDKIKGDIKDSGAEFVHHDSKLEIQESINSVSLKWLKKAITYLG